ncbi:DUF1007 family protein [Celerinatantimonas sp. YJH-8]|uniref:DUF1007 family protein n=1 Tax=Celerinatantimonas sp. YJH-8 TaxID=3228714 RepID=UPI0038C44585
MRIFLMLLLSAWSLTLQAHPHSWIEQQTTLIGDEQHITQLKMRWSFDKITTAYTLEGEDLKGAQRAKTLKKVADQIAAHMMPDHYFTYFYQDQTPLRYHVVRHADAELIDHKLILEFTITLSKPQPYTQHPLKLMIFDPSYYVDMYWNNAADIKLTAPVAKHCQSQLLEPHPSQKDINYAMSIPADADPDYPLGQLFTQKLILRCHP